MRAAAVVLAAIVAIAGAARAAYAQGDGSRRDAPPPPPPAPKVTKAPVLLQAQAPDYPPAALAAGKQAQVKVRLHLDAGGLVTGVDVLEPVGDGFDAAAVAAAMQYVFEPAEIDGVPAPIQVETAINFVIEQVEPAEPIEPRPGPDTGAPAGPPEHAGPMAKPITVEGEAVERGTRRRLAGVIVSIAELALDAVTDANGKFYFHGVPPGTYQLLAVDEKFDRFARAVVVGKDEVVEARLWMRPRGGNPYETIVEGEREVLEVTRRTLDRHQLTTVPGTFGDPIRVISTLPGVARAPFGLGLLLIRGSNPDDTGVFLDGHSLPLLFHFLGGPSVINPEFVEGLELYPGGFPARFGRFHGGVVAIESREAKADGVHGSADVDLLDTGGYIRVPITKNLAIAVAGRRSYLDAVLAFALPEPEPGSQLVVAPVYWDSQLRIDWDGKDKGKLSVFALASSDRLEVVEAEEGDEETYSLDSAIKFWRVITSYKRKLNDTLTLTLSPAFGQASVGYAGSQADATSAYTSLTIKQNTIAYRMRVNGRAASWLALDAGLDLESRVTLYDATIPLTDAISDPLGADIPPEQIRRSVEQIAAAGYVDLGIDVTRKLKVIPSLRLDRYLLNGSPRSSIDPRLVGRYAVTPTFTAKGYLGIFHQPPQPEALDDRVGNPDLELEWAVHSGLGGEWKPTRLWTVDAEIYYIDRRDVVVYTPELVTHDDGTAERLYWVNTGRRWSYGLEGQIKREITESIYGWLSYTFSISRQSRSDSQEVFGEPTTAEPTAFDQMHNLNAVVSWKPGGGWELGARLRAGSGRPDTPVIGATFDADTGEYLPVTGDFRSVRTKFYQQLDLRAERTWLFKTWSLGLYLDIQNVYNYDNVEATQYDYRYQDSAPVTGIPFLPTLGVRGQW